MKANEKRLIACAAISLLAAVTPAGREIERPETAVRLVEGGTFRAQKGWNGFRFHKKAFRNKGRR